MVSHCSQLPFVSFGLLLPNARNFCPVCDCAGGAHGGAGGAATSPGNAQATAQRHTFFSSIIVKPCRGIILRYDGARDTSRTHPRAYAHTRSAGGRGRATMVALPLPPPALAHSPAAAPSTVPALCRAGNRQAHEVAWRRCRAGAGAVGGSRAGQAGAGAWGIGSKCHGEGMGGAWAVSDNGSSSSGRKCFWENNVRSCLCAKEHRCRIGGHPGTR